MVKTDEYVGRYWVNYKYIECWISDIETMKQYLEEYCRHTQPVYTNNSISITHNNVEGTYVHLWR